MRKPLISDAVRVSVSRRKKPGRLLVHMVSLGCSKNLVDSERLMAAIKAMGFKATLEPEAADLLVVNTCAFIQTATEEAISVILDLSARKRSSAKLAVLGCLASRYGQELSGSLPEADLILAPEGYEGFVDNLGSWYLPKASSRRRRIFRPPAKQKPKAKAAPAAFRGPFETWARYPGTPPWRSWLKIAEGCDNRCSYCLIPSLRGPLKLRKMDDLLQEAEKLVGAGVKELTLVAQDLTAWSDRDKGLGDLVSSLSELEGLVWVRLMYAYPERLNQRLVDSLAGIAKLVPYLDVPVQHASPKILKSMGRAAKNPLRLIKDLRKWWPGVALRTTLMVGFPGETDEDYDLLVRFLESAAFEQAGVFKFSPEEGAKASAYPDQVPGSVKERRRRNLMSRQRKISLALNQARVGQRKLILVEGPSSDTDYVMTGRAYFQAPEVDGLVYFDGKQPKPGQMVMATFQKAGPYDLAANMEQRPQ
jgi:ribosomal protein S12 methylthiotransferase